MLGADSDFRKAARHSESGDKAVEYVGGVLAGLSHRRGYQGLPFGVVRFVPAHHRGQHHARRIAVRHVVHRAEHVPDAMACAHRYACGQRPHREPCSDLAIHPRLEIARVCLYARQRLRQHRKSLQGLRVGVRVRLARAQPFHTMIDRAVARREPQPFRRMHGYRGVENGRARDHQLMAKHLLDFGARIGDAGNRAELAAGNRCRYTDLAYLRRCHFRRDALHGADPVDILDAANVVGQAKLHGLRAVGDRPAAYRDDKVGICSARLFGGGDHGFARGVRGHRIEGPHSAAPEAFPDFVDLIGISMERAADHQKSAVQAQTVQLGRDRLGGGAAENNLLHRAENDTPGAHDAYPPRCSGLCWPLKQFSGGTVPMGTIK